MLPQISPSPLTSVKEPIGHPNWIYELKHDGFRGVLYVDRDQTWLVSRKGKRFRQFDPLLKQVLLVLNGREAPPLLESGMTGPIEVMGLMRGDGPAGGATVKGYFLFFW